MKLKVLLLIAQGFLRRKSMTNAKRIFPDTTWNGKGFKHAAYFGTWQPRCVLNFILFQLSSAKATMYNSGTFKLAIG